MPLSSNGIKQSTFSPPPTSLLARISLVRKMRRESWRNWRTSASSWIGIARRKRRENASWQDAQRHAHTLGKLLSLEKCGSSQKTPSGAKCGMISRVRSSIHAANSGLFGHAMASVERTPFEKYCAAPGFSKRYRVDWI